MCERIVFEKKKDMMSGLVNRLVMVEQIQYTYIAFLNSLRFQKVP